MIAGRRYMQLAAIWHLYLPLYMYNVLVFLLLLSVLLLLFLYFYFLFFCTVYVHPFCIFFFNLVSIN